MNRKRSRSTPALEHRVSRWQVYPEPRLLRDRLYASTVCPIATLSGSPTSLHCHTAVAFHDSHPWATCSCFQHGRSRPFISNIAQSGRHTAVYCLSRACDPQQTRPIGTSRSSIYLALRYRGQCSRIILLLIEKSIEDVKAGLGEEETSRVQVERHHLPITASAVY